MRLLSLSLSLSLSLCPVGLARQLWLPFRSPTLAGPCVSPIGSVPPEPPACTTRASPWTPRPRRMSRLRPPFLAAQYPTRSPPPSFAHSHTPHSPRTTCAPRELHCRPSWFRTFSASTVGSPRVCCPGELCLDANNSGHPTWFACSPLSFTARAHQTPHRAVVSLPPPSRVPVVSSPLLKHARAISRDNQPTHALNFPFHALLSVQSLVVIDVLHRPAAPLRTAPSGASALVSCPQPSPPCYPELA
jgi:hypothetical protein